MARGKAVNNIKKVKIMAFHEERLSFREIGRKLDRSDKIVRNFLRNPDALWSGQIYRKNKDFNCKKKV